MYRLSTLNSCQNVASCVAKTARAHSCTRSMQQVSASALASPINGTQCGAALTVYALTKTGSSFVRAHFEHAVLGSILLGAVPPTNPKSTLTLPAVGQLLEIGCRSRPPLLGPT
jgi:hypothetical protein